MSYRPVQNVVIRKSVTESVTASTVLQNDDQLRISIAPNEEIVFEFVLFVDGAATGDFKCALTSPTGSVGRWALLGFDIGMTTILDSDMRNDAHTTFDASTFAISGIESDIGMIILHGVVKNGSTSGMFQLQWAQNNSVAPNTSVNSSSYLSAKKFQ